MRNSTVRTFRRHCLASLALLTVGFALAPTQPAAADERGVELDPDGLEPIYEVNPIRFYDPWLIEAMGRIDEVLDADLPPLDLGSSLGVIDSCASFLALIVSRRAAVIRAFGANDTTSPTRRVGPGRYIMAATVRPAFLGNTKNAQRSD